VEGRMRKKDVRFIVVALLLIAALVGMLSRLILSRLDTLREGTGTGQEDQTPTPSIPETPTEGSTGSAWGVVVPTSVPTPTSLLSMGITPIVPEDKTEVKDGEETEVGEGQLQEDKVQQQLPVWTAEGEVDIGDLYVLADFIGHVYAEQEGVSVVGMPVGTEEYGVFKNPCAYYVDRYGFLYVNMKVVLEDGSSKYLTCALGYYGSDLAVYDIEEVN